MDRGRVDSRNSRPVAHRLSGGRRKHVSPCRWTAGAAITTGYDKRSVAWCPGQRHRIAKAIEIRAPNRVAAARVQMSIATITSPLTTIAIPERRGSMLTSTWMVRAAFFAAQPQYSRTAKRTAPGSLALAAGRTVSNLAICRAILSSEPVGVCYGDGEWRSRTVILYSRRDERQPLSHGGFIRKGAVVERRRCVAALASSSGRAFGFAALRTRSV